MKKIVSLIFSLTALSMITGCGKVVENIKKEDTKDNIIENNKVITWEEITDEGVNEVELFNNLDLQLLEKIASLFQNIDKEIAEKEIVSPEYVLRGNWVQDIIKNEQYKEVISIGKKAMKPLYWIIYKSDNQGRYEYICALALEELSGFNFDEDGDGVKWASSKEFLKEFNKKVTSNK